MFEFPVFFSIFVKICSFLLILRPIFGRRVCLVQTPDQKSCIIDMRWIYKLLCTNIISKTDYRPFSALFANSYKLYFR